MNNKKNTNMNPSHQNLFLVRGVPCSGKSTLASQLGGTHFETDNYFLDKNGKYKFDPTKIKNAHNWCQSEVGNAMILNHTTGLNDTIVVSNTFTQEWEMKPYIDMAKNWGYRVFTIIVESRHDGVNQHGVPDEKLQQMKDRFEISL